ncbi:MAG: hypothetical protein J2P37_27250, partial [Ktedonobacteraceae bacterium]|nr:hypothetical protein [Ktedonobacteraceae bacterium]
VQARIVRESRDPADQPTMATEPVAPPAGGRAARRSETGETIRGTVGPGKKGTPSGGGVQVPPSNGVQDRVLAPAASSVSSGQREVQALGEDDVAIFEQLRHQMLLWLRVEAVRAGLDISGYSPMQLLDLLRQNARCEETRLQVVSTLLNLANQVIKTGAVSVLDYKQALMFHLMHTRP